MIRLATSLFMLAALSANASWYWPFDSDDEKRPPRLSELMAGATTNIDAAVDFADEGKTSEAIEAYRRALVELNRIEAENPERAKRPEFATLRNKRAYVTAAIDSLLLDQVRSNAKVVAVSDTSAIEKKFAEEKARKEKAAEKKSEDAKKAEEKKAETAPAPEPVSKPAAAALPASPSAAAPQSPRTLRDRVIADIEKGDWAAADLGIAQLLAAKPNDAVALNLKAALEMERGNAKEAEAALDQAIMSNPRSPFAYYNMADLMLKKDPPNRDSAKRYYETGRAMGGARDERLESLLK